jgi:hypothetical protein
MGRPINKRYFGSLDVGTAQSATNPTVDGGDGAGNTLTSTSLYGEKGRGYNIPVYSARVSGQSEVTGGIGGDYPFIQSQKSSRSYRVRTSATATHVGTCRLVNKAAGALAAGEMLLQGFLSGDTGAGSPTLIAKLTKFYATDFNGNRYKWYVAPNTGEDSTQANAIVLVVATDTSIN